MRDPYLYDKIENCLKTTVDMSGQHWWHITLILKMVAISQKENILKEL